MEYIPGGTESLEDANGNPLYTPGGVYLGNDLSSAAVRYFDSSYGDTDFYYLLEYYCQNLYALISTTHKNAKISSTCVTAGIMGLLKGIEAYRNYETVSYPLYGDQIGRFVEYDNNFKNYWPGDDNIVLSGKYYQNDSRYPLAVLSDDYNKISYVYNESLAVAYYVDKYGSAEKNIVKSISKYLVGTKTSNKYRYRIINEANCYYNVRSTGYKESFQLIRQAILNDKVVLIGDDDFAWPNGYIEGDSTGGHVMLAVGTGITKIYDKNNQKWYRIEEIVFDQGGGEYAAMPIDDVNDFFIVDMRLQKKEKYGILNLTRWVNV